MAKNTTKIEDKAVRAVGDYIDDCPKLKSYCQSNDKTPVWDGDIFIYKSEEEHNVKNIFARVPLQIKGTTNTEDGFYRIEREYIKAYQAERGCVFFMVQEDKETYKPIRILYAMLALEDVNALLQQKTQTIKIDLKEVPANPRDFETELIKFAKKRNREMIDNPAPKEIASLVKKFKEIEKHLDEVEDKGARIELKSFIDTIIGLKNDGTVGWRDTFVHLSRKALDLASKHIEGYDFLYLQHDLGLYLHEQKLYHLVEDYYVQSLKELRERATANPDAFLPDVAMTLNNLANLHSDLNRFEMAEKEFKEALEIYRELAKANPDAFLPDVATTLNNLAALHSDLNRFEMAEEEYKEALVILKLIRTLSCLMWQQRLTTLQFCTATLTDSKWRRKNTRRRWEYIGNSLMLIRTLSCLMWQQRLTTLQPCTTTLTDSKWRSLNTRRRWKSIGNWLKLILTLSCLMWGERFSI